MNRVVHIAVLTTAIAFLAGIVFAQSPGAAPAPDPRAVSPRATSTKPDRPSAEKRREERQARSEQARERAEQAAEEEQAILDSLQEAYDTGTDALDEGRWQVAVMAFETASKKDNPRADGALYWKAYSLNKLGRRREAIATLRALEKRYPKSRWLTESQALAAQVRAATGRAAPAEQQDSDVVLMALNSMQKADPDQAVPLLEKFIDSDRTPKQKERALFVLMQMDSAKARDVVVEVAKGKGNPDLQLRAITYLGTAGRRDNADRLADVYQSSSDPDVKRAVLHSLMVSGQKDRIVALAKSERDPLVRQEAIKQLSAMGGQAQLWQFYDSEPTAEGKENILKTMVVDDNADKLAEVARSEKDARLRRAAVRRLGTAGKSGSDVLSSVYAGEQDPDVKREIIIGLSAQQNAKALVGMAREEQDPDLKKEIIRRLSLMRSKEATDYLMEILK